MVDSSRPIWEAGRLLQEGFIVTIKGNGGFHIATATTEDEPIARLRREKGRESKPLAIMGRDIGTVRTFTNVDNYEEELLTSYIRPIVVLNKSSEYWLSELLSPGLHNIGVMLPYTGLHYMLFDECSEPAFVMTSANAAGEPIVKENEEALRKLGPHVDYLLVHDRRIAQRCDDSVLRVLNGKHSFIRRSRGYAPEPILVDTQGNPTVLALGGELNVTVTILQDGKAYSSQHVGDLETLEAFDHLLSTVDHMMTLTGVETPDIVACDLHPKFLSSDHAERASEEWGSSLVRLQHHYAHVASLLGEHGLDEVIGLACDGYGYGSDGSAWGGEVLHCWGEGFERLGHLEPQPMVGGDLATRYPLRMAAGMISGHVDFENWLAELSGFFPHGSKEVELLLSQLRQGVSLFTTSFGRALDTVSAVLSVCRERTYEGEPAMRLESVARGGRDVLRLKPMLDGNSINTTRLLLRIFENRLKQTRRDLAFSAEAYLANSMADFTCEKALELGVQIVGLTGGVAYNEHVAVVVKRAVEAAGLRFVANERVPPGDGGVSFGQAVAASSASL